MAQHGVGGLSGCLQYEEPWGCDKEVSEELCPAPWVTGPAGSEPAPTEPFGCLCTVPSAAVEGTAVHCQRTKPG